ncbi:hypothetical protein PJW07_25540, partial [Agrobacterium salinitolerans]|uniref:hypothetical protein n=1 Tax=Agrobacterium salinitolerans TaxID=1183413 RepID=UPI002301800D
SNFLIFHKELSLKVIKLPWERKRFARSLRNAASDIQRKPGFRAAAATKVTGSRTSTPAKPGQSLSIARNSSSG